MRRFPFFLFPVLAVLGLSACSRPPLPGRTPPEPSAGRMQITDAIGRRVELTRQPRRIVSLAPSVTEVLFMIGAGDRVIGVTTHCNWPEAARAKPRIADLLNPSYEKILDAGPDLVIATTAGNDQRAVMKLADLGLPLFVTAPRTIESIWQSVEQIGRITGLAERAEEVVGLARGRIAEVERRLAGLPPTRALFVTWFDPLLAPGRRTFETSVLRCAGVESITADIEEYYPRFSLEQVLARRPDVILTVENAGQALPDLRRMAGWSGLEAVRRNRVFVLPESLQHPSPRFVEGVEFLARAIHPERFP